MAKSEKTDAECEVGDIMPDALRKKAKPKAKTAKVPDFVHVPTHKIDFEDISIPLTMAVCSDGNPKLATQRDFIYKVRKG